MAVIAALMAMTSIWGSNGTGWTTDSMVRQLEDCWRVDGAGGIQLMMVNAEKQLLTLDTDG